MIHDDPPPAGPDVPPPAKPPTATDAVKPVAKITGGLVLGFVLGFALPFAGIWLDDALGSAVLPGILGSGVVGGLAFCGLVIVSVPWLWRRGLRGIPIGLCIGVALPTLILVVCAA